MDLRDLFRGLVLDAGALPEVEIEALAYDDRDAGPGCAFFCVPGFTWDGHDFAPAAVARGAAALVVERPLGLGVPEVLVPDARAAMAPAAARLHGDPTSALRIVGITGTNGKTTTAFLVRALLEAAGVATGLIGTVDQIVGGERTAAERTTPEALDLQRLFAHMRDAGDRACVMEVSSHALALHRADAIQWDTAIFTNLTQDHLDFHPTMEAYFEAKRMLFAADPRVRIANVDDPYGRRLADEFPGTVRIGIDSQDADLRATFSGGTRFTADGREWESPLPGRFNVLNALCAIAAGRSAGLADEAIAAALADAVVAPGRFEPIDAGQDFTVLLDYAHTPDSLDNVLRAARELIPGKVIVVFGCGGDRDRGKRPLMGEIAARGADAVVVTSDNPRSEDPDAIIEEVLAGVPASHAARVRFIADRAAAIGDALAEAAAGDVVVIAGKGHEQGQELAGGVVVPFDDRTVARAALEQVRG
ncbi:unannotated protein [freshwater metagenome]|uniref:Unannotated protein n=1 Tax=freshwater metagenome TaxID=449393 RepID=A0A6J7I884_9ZZZZ|nr:UDP-N-acetylmuramoyl-L-alanyl-D-glutamate--2,6-diaminopimelate ligase [Actinomycetota bacterium]